MPVNSFADYPMSWQPALPREAGPQPLYRVLAAQLARDIASGVLRPGTKLPPQRELADFLDISVSTVTKAFRICSNKGLLTSTVGSGTFVAYDARTCLSVAPERQQTVIEMGSMMPETLPQDGVTAILEQMLQEASASHLYQYSNPKEVRHQDAARSFLRQAGALLPENKDVLISLGGQNALAAILPALFKAGDRIGVDPLIYPGLKRAASLFGIRLVPINQTNGEMSRHGLLQAISDYHIKGVYVTPDFQNPTTHILSHAGRQMLAEIAREKNLVIVEDAIASLLLPRPVPPVQSLAPERTVYILSLSKAILPALRLAYMAVPEPWQGQIEQVLETLELAQSALLLELADRIIVSGEYEAILRERQSSLVRRNELTERILAGFAVAGDRYSLCRWLVLPAAWTGERFEREALRHGVRVLGAQHFAVGRKPWQEGVRLAIGAPRNLDQLEQALTTIKGLLED